MKKKNAGHATFYGKVAALEKKGYPKENATRIAGAMVRDMALRATKAGRKVLKAAGRKAHQLHLGLMGK